MRLIASILCLCLLAGCVSPAEEASEPLSTHPEPRAETVVLGRPVTCADERGHHGIHSGMGDSYTFAGADGVHHYEESNGMTGLQTEEGCPQAPDTRIA